MSLLGADGFDLHPVGAAPDSLEGVFARSTTAGDITIEAAGGRGGTGNVRFGAGAYLDASVPASGELWFAIALKYNSAAHGIVQFRNGSGAILSVLRNASGFIEVYKGTQAGTLIATSTTAYLGVYKALAVKVLFDGAAGTVQVRCAGAATLEIDLTGQDTAGVAGNCTVIRMGDWYTSNGFEVWYADDFVWGDVAGALNNSCPPDLTVTKVLPTGDTADADFTPSAGTDHYALVDDATHDGDSTYVESSTVGHKDRYTHSTTPSGVTIRAVIGWTVAKGGGSLRHVVTGTGGTEAESAADIVTNGAAYQSSETVFETDPDTGVAWTPAGVADADVSFGQKVAA